MEGEPPNKPEAIPPYSLTCISSMSPSLSLLIGSNAASAPPRLTPACFTVSEMSVSLLDTRSSRVALTKNWGEGRGNGMGGN